MACDETFSGVLGAWLRGQEGVGRLVFNKGLFEVGLFDINRGDLEGVVWKFWNSFLRYFFSSNDLGKILVLAILVWNFRFRFYLLSTI